MKKTNVLWLALLALALYIAVSIGFSCAPNEIVGAECFVATTD